MGKCVPCTFGHIFLTYYIMADVIPCDIMENIMSKYCGRCFLPQCLSDCFMFCGIIWPTCVMADDIAICYG